MESLSDVTLRPGTYLDSEGLRLAARAAARLSGLTHEQIGGLLGVSSGAISLALAKSGGVGRDGPRRAILEALTTARFSGPYWRTELPPRPTSTGDDNQTDEDDGADDDGEEESSTGRADG